jgi:hypothetical protein
MTGYVSSLSIIIEYQGIYNAFEYRLGITYEYYFAFLLVFIKEPD